MMLLFKKRSLQFLKYCLLIISVVGVIYPLIFIIMGSLKSEAEIFMNPFGLPSNPNWSIYYEILFEKGFIVNIFNSLYYSITTMVITAIICFMGAYAISRMKWKLSGAFLAALMLGIMIPTDAMILPLYVITNKVGINNPRITLVAIYTAFALPRTIFILIGFLKDIPKSIEEAAIIDGCNIWQVMFKMIFPIIKPALATVGIFNFLTVWNDLLMSLIFISKNADMTIQTGLMKFQGVHETQYGIMLAGVTIVILPIMITYIIMQKNIISGMTAGATKG